MRTLLQCLIVIGAVVAMITDARAIENTARSDIWTPQGPDTEYYDNERAQVVCECARQQAADNPNIDPTSTAVIKRCERLIEQQDGGLPGSRRRGLSSVEHTT